MDPADSAAAAAPRSVTAQVLEDGFFAGVIGGGLVAAWYLLLDAIAQRPLYTPAMLGAVLFRGATDPTAVVIQPELVAWYSALHFLAFLAVGFLASWLAVQFERFPTVGVAILFLFVIFETGFFVFAFTIGRAILGTLGLWTIAVANLLAAAGMSTYLLRRHPTALSNLGRIWTDQE